MIITTKCLNCKTKFKFELGIYGMDTQNIQISWQCKKCLVYSLTYPKKESLKLLRDGYIKVNFVLSLKVFGNHK